MTLFVSEHFTRNVMTTGTQTLLFYPGAIGTPIKIIALLAINTEENYTNVKQELLKVKF